MSFLIFHEKIPLMPIFCQNTVHSLKNTLFSCSYFVIKTSILSKTMCFHVIVFKFYEKSLLARPYLVQKKRQFCQTYPILLTKKVNRKPFFSIFTKKSFLSYPEDKNIHSLKNKPLSCSYFVTKRPFSRKHYALVSFFF